MRNYVVSVQRPGAILPENVVAEFGGVYVRFVPSKAGPRVTSRWCWSGSTLLPKGVLGEMSRQAAAIFAGPAGNAGMAPARRLVSGSGRQLYLEGT
jgi:hypothetical protein